MTTDLQKKTRLRKGYRDVLERRLGEADVAISTMESSGTVDAVKCSQLKLSLNEKINVIKRLDDEIVGLVDVADIDSEIDETEFHEIAYAILARIEAQLKIASEAKITGSVIPPSTGAKLPKLNLPVFNGEVTEWVTFWDSYKAAVHDDPSLSPIQKFNYLRSLVRKSAYSAIAGLTLTAANYTEALKLLELRFGNPERIISKHMEALLSLESVSSQCNTGALRALYDKIETHTRELKALGVAAEAYNCLLPSLIMKKIPNELGLIINRRIPESEWKLERIMNELGEELRVRERTVARVEPSRMKEGQVRTRERPTTIAMQSNSGNCCYCAGEHVPEACTKVDKYDKRKSILRDGGRCFICLKRGHLSRNCRSNIRCTFCNSRHHTSICSKGHQSDSQPQVSSKLDPNVAPFKVPSLLTRSKETVLLQTALGSVRNKETGEGADLRVIFDSGSQRSYISQKAKRKLALRSLGKKDLIISTFGDNEGKRRTCEFVKAVLENGEGWKLDLTLLVIPLICEPLPVDTSVKESVQRYEHLRDMEFADSVGKNEVVEFDILIGLDYYWDVVTGEVVKGGGGPTAVHSRLGWLLSGPVTSSTTTLVTHVLSSGIKPGQEKAELVGQLKRFWDLESLGIEEKESTLYDQFKNNVKFDGVRYEVTLPWRDHVTSIPDNYQLSLGRLRKLLVRLRQNPNLLEEYDKVISSQIESGIVEMVDDPSQSEGDRIHYLPHHAVVRQNKETTKLRVVYDASAKTMGPSLNECLHIGPKFNQRTEV